MIRLLKIRRTARSTVTGFIFGLPIVSSASAQIGPRTLQLRDPPICEGCRIELERVVTLGEVEGLGRLGTGLYSVARDSRGRYLVATDQTDGFALYDASGRFLQWVTVESAQPNPEAAEDSDPAQPPPDLPAVSHVEISAGDTVHVLDARTRSHVVLAPAADGYAGARRYPLPSAMGILWDALVLPGEEVLMPGNLTHRDHAGYPLHIVDTDGQIRFSFGVDVARWVPGEELSTGTRKLALADSGSVWAAQTTRYRIERWTLDGQRELALERSTPWFPPFVEFRSITPDNPPQSWLMDLWQDDAGRLWTLVGVGATEWSAGLRKEPLPDRPDRYVTEDVERVFDTVIEVFDPACGHLLISQRVPSFLLQKMDGDLVAGWRTSPAGPPLLDVWRVELYQPQREVVDSCVEKR